jgi:predicted regulator of Ras-like GTPase activity (Roadblock/LC7/MglB family)
MVRMKVNLVGASNACLSIPIEKILEQLAYGSIHLSIDELKQFSPPQVFAQVEGQDQLMVELPLAEVLSRLDPALLKRKQEQKRIEVPKSVTDLFGSRGHALPQAPPTPEEEAAGVVAPKQVVPTPPIAAKPVTPPARTTSARASSPASLRERAPAPAAASKPAATVAAAPAVSPLATPAGLGDAVVVPLSAVSSAWPEGVRREMVEQNLSGATLGLPSAKVDDGLRVGHVAFTWKEIRNWLNPAPTVAASPETSETLLELPLSVVAPLLLPKLKSGRQQKKAAIGDDIPDVFGKSGEHLFGAAAAPVEAPRPIPVTPAEAAHTHAPRLSTHEPTQPKEKPPQSLEDLLGKAPKKPATPNEVVQKLVALPGVVGALITLQEGLLVASHWVPGVKPDTLGAFVPQIFSRINQYLREMQLGDMHNATFTLDKTALHVFKSGNLYFAVLGRAGQPLPVPSILAIASELTPQHS